MFEKTLGFLSSKISMMLSSEQSNKQPLGRQPSSMLFDQNLRNNLSHTSKDSIASQTWLSWQGRHWKWMTSEKHVSNNQWKPWHAHANIQVSSNPLPSTKRPWKYTHCGGMGERFQKCSITTWSTSPIMDNDILLRQGGLDMEGQTQLVTFKWNRVKLAWAFINIMNAVHHRGILHNDLSKDHIMLHLPLDKFARCCVHKHVWLGWTWALARGDAIIIWVCNGTICHHHKKCVLVGCFKIVFCLQQVGNYIFPWMNGQAKCHNFEVWNIFDGQVGKCHMGWWLH